MARQPLEQAGAEGEDVAAIVDLVPARLLAREVGELAFDHARLRLRQAPRGLGQAEVDHLHLTLEGEQDVLGRDVTVDDAHGIAQALGRVRRVQRARDAHRHVHGDGRRQGRSSVQLHQPIGHAPHVAAVNVLEGDVELLVHTPEVEDLRNIRMRETNGDLRLVDEHARELVVAEAWQDALDRQLLLEAHGATARRSKDFGHPADRHALVQLVLAEALESADHRRQASPHPVPTSTPGRLALCATRPSTG